MQKNSSFCYLLLTFLAKYAMLCYKKKQVEGGRKKMRQHNMLTIVREDMDQLVYQVIDATKVEFEL